MVLKNLLMKFKPKLLIAKKLNINHLKLLKVKLSKYYQIIIPKKYNKLELINLIKDARVCIGTSGQNYLINQNNVLEVFQNIGSGLDGFKLEDLRNKKILLGKSNENSLLVAEYAVGMMMYLAKNFNEYLIPVNITSKIKKLPTNILTKKKIGIIGYGSIGKNIVKLLYGFNNIFYVKTNFNKKKDTLNMKYKSINYILKNSDIIFICVPHTDKTTNLINNSNYKSISNNTLIINLSRSEIFQLSALKKLIRNKDVKISFDSNYKNQNDSRRFNVILKNNNKNLFFTPYIAALDEFASYPINLIIENLIYFSNNRRLKYSINYQKGY